MSSNFTPQAPPPSTPDSSSSSDLEDLVIKARYLNRSTRIFLHYLPHTNPHTPTPHLRERFAHLQGRFQELASHYGWALASDREQVLRVEEKLDMRGQGGILRHGGVLDEFCRVFGEVDSVGGILGDFLRLEGELRVVGGGVVRVG
ncbi:hypothetical protein IAQ61_003437 [Plenodomus lingam]|uniref:uncharacterized protein n=1 Tax=Leptosphaeria maculans TaxID=5022 RepID=UPI0033252672|nr:hypothetical protein IAQ61_003437 [Plenodomus lingam]